MQAAATLVGPRNPSTVAKALGLEWSKMKEAIKKYPVRDHGHKRSAPIAASPFVELTLPKPDILGVVKAATPLGAAALEIDRADGSRLRLSQDVLLKLDIAAVLQQFLSQSSR